MLEYFDLLSEEEATRMIRHDLQQPTLARWRKRGFGPAHIKLGRRIYYRREAVRDWLLAQEGGAK